MFNHDHLHHALHQGPFRFTGPDVPPMQFESRPEARDWCKIHYPGSPIKEENGPAPSKSPGSDPVISRSAGEAPQDGARWKEVGAERLQRRKLLIARLSIEL